MYTLISTALSADRVTVEVEYNYGIQSDATGVKVVWLMIAIDSAPRLTGNLFFRLSLLSFLVTIDACLLPMA